MFSIFYGLFKVLDKVKKERKLNGLGNAMIVLVDVITLIYIIYIVIENNPGNIAFANDVFAGLLKTLIISVIISATLKGTVYKKGEYENKGILIGVKLLLSMIPIILIIIPVLANNTNLANVALFFNYIFFILILGVIFDMLSDTHKEELKKKKKDRLKGRSGSRFRKRSPLYHKFKKEID